DFGYYIWVDGDRVQLRTTDRGNGPGPSEYTGTVTANGEMRDVNLIRQENDDWAVAAGNTLDFHFRTFNAVDGVAFTAHGATRISPRSCPSGGPLTLPFFTHVVEAETCRDPAELVTGAEKHGFHRLARDAEDRADLLAGQALALAQDERLPVARGHPGEDGR